MKPQGRQISGCKTIVGPSADVAAGGSEALQRRTGKEDRGSAKSIERLPGQFLNVGGIQSPGRQPHETLFVGCIVRGSRSKTYSSDVKPM